MLASENFIEVNLVDQDVQSASINLVDDLQDYRKRYAPRPPVIEAITASQGNLEIFFNLNQENTDEVVVNVYRDGRLVAEKIKIFDQRGSWQDQDTKGSQSPSYCYTLESVYLNSGTISQRAKPVCYWGVNSERVYSVTAQEFRAIGRNPSEAHGQVYFKYGSLPVAIRELAGKKRAFIVTDKPLFDLGVTAPLEEVLEEIGITINIFYDVEPDPSLETVERGLNVINTFNPDVIIAIGGGSPMDAAKIMWLLYEHPEIEFESLAMRFMDIRKRVYELPPLGEKALMVCIPTTSGTGSEVTPFAVVTDRRNNIKYPLADYALTPSMAIVDPELVLNMPKKLTAYGGIDALTHALEAYVSVLASEYTNALAHVRRAHFGLSPRLLCQ